MVSSCLLHILLVISGSYYHVFIFFFLLPLSLVDIIIHDEFFKEIVLGASERDETVTFESITVASAFLSFET